MLSHLVQFQISLTLPVLDFVEQHGVAAPEPPQARQTPRSSNREKGVQGTECGLLEPAWILLVEPPYEGMVLLASWHLLRLILVFYQC
jgi:hypothetical protein